MVTSGSGARTIFTRAIVAAREFMNFRPRNLDHVEAARRALGQLKNFSPGSLNGEMDSIDLMDYLVYEGIGVFPGMTDGYVTAASVFADVLVRKLHFREEANLGDDRLFVLVHEQPKITIMPWPRVYEAMKTFSSSASPFAHIFLDVVRRFFDKGEVPDHAVHPVFDIVRARSKRYPGEIVDLVEQLYNTRGTKLIDDLRIEPYLWGNVISWSQAECSLEALLKEPDVARKAQVRKRK
jgi:hypothetical protein